jgi:hypothetical protein
VVISSLAYLLWVERKFSIGFFEFSWRVFYLTLPLVVFWLAAMKWTTWALKKAFGRRAGGWEEE